VQVDPIRPTLKAPEPERLKPERGELLSNFAFKINTRRYTEAAAEADDGNFPVVGTTNYHQPNTCAPHVFESEPRVHCQIVPGSPGPKPFHRLHAEPSFLELNGSL